MLLALDIGNTNIVIGLFKNGHLINVWRLLSSVKKSADDYAVDIVEIFLTNKIDCLKIEGCIIASVVPTLRSRLHDAVRKFLSEITEILVVGEGGVWPKIKIELPNKNEIGHDRLINALAGYRKYNDGLIIVDFGTATTFDVVGSAGQYLGGVIAPGINLSLKALHDMTAQLPKISIRPQKNVIGKNTFEAMNSGVYHGYCAMIEGMIHKIEAELEFTTTRIITGGLAEIFKEPLKNLKLNHEANLTLEGLKIVFDDTVSNKFTANS